VHRHGHDLEPTRPRPFGLLCRPRRHQLGAAGRAIRAVRAPVYRRRRRRSNTRLVQGRRALRAHRPSCSWSARIAS
jgi:hypothetical protein